MEKCQQLCFFTKNNSIATPVDFYNELDKHWKFDFDPCPLEKPEWDGLVREWGERNWVNPPFSQLEQWIRKGIQELKKGRTSVFLIPNRSNSNYWHELVFPNATGIHWLKKIVFQGYKKGLPVPLVLVEFEPGKKPMFQKGEMRDSWDVSPSKFSDNK